MNSFPYSVVISELFGENCYIISPPNRDDCVIVDPGLNPERILEEIDRQGRAPAALLNTHGHADHIAGNEAIKERWPEIPLVIGEGDASKLTDPRSNLSATYGMAILSPQADVLVNEGDVYSAAGIDFEVLDTPGHCSGHVAFVCKGSSPWVVLGGDVLFKEGIGRYDFPDSDAQALVHSITVKLFSLPDDTLVLPGHGPTTTIGEEKEHNPFVGKRRGQWG